MAIEIMAVGGFGEVGKNMTAVKIDDEVVIFDMGLHLPNYIKYTEEEEAELVKFSRKELINVKAVPDDNVINDWRDKVIAIIPSHAHLDHIGAVPYLASRYNAPIICTPFTIEVIKAILKDQRIKLENELKPLNANSKLRLSKNLTVEFVNITHSTPQTVVVALHTKYGAIVYCNDFKLDNTPTLGQKPNYEALKKLGDQKVKLAIVDSLYAWDHRKMPGEIIAKEMLKDVLLGIDNKGKGIIVTTFSSHIARIKSIIEFARQLNRKVVILGRSLAKYCSAAENAQIVFFSKEAEIIGFGKHVKKRLSKIEKEGRDKYLIVTTGHQGEPKSILSRISRGEIEYSLSSDDHIIFSCNVIPTEVNIDHRKKLEESLKSFGVRLFKGIHVSGHGAREDMRDLINLIKPEHVIPAHSEKEVIAHFIELGKEMGYKDGKNMHTLLTGLRLKIL